MRTSAAGRRRPLLAEVLEDAVQALVQDVSEYAFIGFIGAAAAFLCAVVLRLINTPLSNAFVMPAVGLIAIWTMAAATTAYCNAMDNMQPDAGRSFGTVMLRAPAFARPWLPLITGLFAAMFGLSWFNLNGDELSRLILLVALTGIAGGYTLPRTFYPAVLATQRMSLDDAESVSVALSRSVNGVLIGLWAAVLAPAAVFALIAVSTGFGPASTAITAFAFVASMPAAAAAMSLLFFYAVEEAQRRTPRRDR